MSIFKSIQRSIFVFLLFGFLLSGCAIVPKSPQFIDTRPIGKISPAPDGMDVAYLGLQVLPKLDISGNFADKPSEGRSYNTQEDISSLGALIRSQNYEQLWLDNFDSLSSATIVSNDEVLERIEQGGKSAMYSTMLTNINSATSIPAIRWGAKVVKFDRLNYQKDIIASIANFLDVDYLALTQVFIYPSHSSVVNYFVATHYFRSYAVIHTLVFDKKGQLVFTTESSELNKTYVKGAAIISKWDWKPIHPLAGFNGDLLLKSALKKNGTATAQGMTAAGSMLKKTMVPLTVPNTFFQVDGDLWVVTYRNTKFDTRILKKVVLKSKSGEFIYEVKGSGPQDNKTATNYVHVIPYSVMKPLEGGSYDITMEYHDGTADVVPVIVDATWPEPKKGAPEGEGNAEAGAEDSGTEDSVPAAGDN